MRLPLLSLSASILALALSAPASAQGLSGTQFSVGPILTTTGIGITGQARFSPTWSASLDLSFLPLPDIGTTYAGEEVTVDSAVRSAVLMGHYHPTGGGLALGVGAYLGGHRFDFDGTPSSSVDIGDNTYSAAELGTIVGEFAILEGPALLLQIGNVGKRLTTGFGVGFPAGANVTLDATGPISQTKDERALQFQRDAREEVQNVRDFAEAWPVVVYARVGYLFGL